MTMKTYALGLIAGAASFLAPQNTDAQTKTNDTTKILLSQEFVDYFGPDLREERVFVLSDKDARFPDLESIGFKGFGNVLIFARTSFNSQIAVGGTDANGDKILTVDESDLIIDADRPKKGSTTLIGHSRAHDGMHAFYQVKFEMLKDNTHQNIMTAPLDIVELLTDPKVKWKFGKGPKFAQAFSNMKRYLPDN